MISHRLSALWLASLLTVACGSEGGAPAATAGSAGGSQSPAGASGSSGHGGDAGTPAAGASGQAGSGQGPAGGPGGSGQGPAGAGGQGPAGASGQAGAASEFVPSEALQRLIDEMAKLKAGQPADLDGDGKVETTRTVASDGSVTMTVDQDGDGNAEFVLQTDGASLISQVVDADSDGQIELEITSESSPDLEVIIRSEDTDLDGQVNRRLTWETKSATRDEQTLTEQVDLDGDGDVDQTTTETLAKSRNTGDCWGGGGFPSGSTGQPVFNDMIRVVSGSSSGQCSGADASSIAAAVDCAMSRGTLCLANTNTNQYNSLMAAGMGETKRALDIACGNSCAGGIANTESWSRWAIYGSRMNINPSEWHKLDAAGQCNIMLHELLHWAGDQGAADHDKKEGPGNDEVYSCGRYCGGCSDAGHGSPGNSAVDCALCADTPERKKQCGVKKQFKERPCNGDLAGVCHSGLACIAGNCTTCGAYKVETCDGKQVSDEASCCAVCPDGCNKSNDVACNGSHMDEDSCQPSTPPFCKK